MLQGMLTQEEKNSQTHTHIYAYTFLFGAHFTRVTARNKKCLLKHDPKTEEKRASQFIFGVSELQNRSCLAVLRGRKD